MQSIRGGSGACFLLFYQLSTYACYLGMDTVETVSVNVGLWPPYEYELPDKDGTVVCDDVLQKSLRERGAFVAFSKQFLICRRPFIK